MKKFLMVSKKRVPLSFVVVGRDDEQDADDLLEIIKQKLQKSSYAIFDTTGGNANVSLEFGFAEASDIPQALYISEHKAAKKTDSAIISDLAGKQRKIYKNEKSLRTLLDQFSKSPNYTKQYELMLLKETVKFTKGQKKSFRALTLKIIHQLDNAISKRRVDLVENLKTEIQNYKEEQIDNALRILNKYRLLNVSTGRYSSVRI